MIAVLYLSGPDYGDTVPFLAMFAVDAVRIMPSAIRCYNAIMEVRAGVPSLGAVEEDYMLFRGLGTDMTQLDIPAKNKSDPTMPFSNAIELKGLEFKYGGAANAALNGLSMHVKKGEAVGIVGPSGAGKSTLLSIILGLLPPTSGSILIDGRAAGDDIKSWQRRIGYIPQSIYLLDDTIVKNVAFGIPKNEIDMDKFWQAVRLAQLEEFITSLPAGENTMVGERGVRISGGQRQRIAIARALYHEPEILVLDEATAALDNETERQITAAINELMGVRTIIIVAHRLSTVANCDRLIFLENGEVAAEGTYEELLKNERFSEIAMGPKEATTE